MEAGVRVESQEDFVFIMRSCMDYFINTLEGKKVMLKALNAETSGGTYKKSYWATDERGNRGQELIFSKAIEYKGWIYGGRAVPHSSIIVQDSPNVTDCDMCQGLRPKHFCVTDVRDPVRDRLISVCNHCRLHFDHPKVRDTASMKTCDSCEMFNCPYNPRREAYQRQLAQIEQKPPVNQPQPLIALARST